VARLRRPTAGLSDSAIENLLAGRPAFSAQGPATSVRETDPAEYSDGFGEKLPESPEESRRKALRRLREYEEKERARKAAEVTTKDVILQKRDQRIELFKQKQQERLEQQKLARSEGVLRSMGASRSSGTPHQRLSGSRLSRSVCKNRFDVEEEEMQRKKAEIERRRNSEIHDYLREGLGTSHTPAAARHQPSRSSSASAAAQKIVGPGSGDGTNVETQDRRSAMIATVLDELEEDLFS